MPESISETLNLLQPDPWRLRVGFSPELESVNHQILKPSSSESEIVDAVCQWLQKYQPCLFGRIAAKRGLISFCVLTENDLNGSDESIAAKIEESHLNWSREGFNGRKSAFILLALSEKIALAEPGPEMMRLAQRLCSFLLRTEVVPDHIYLDELFLELPGPARQTLRFDVGVNYFSANGDGRWWHDHRIPGGMAFSTNSVGHMVKSGKVGRIMGDMEELMDLPPDGWKTTKVDSLEKALEMAMRTIYNAAETPYGKATELLPLPSNADDLAVIQCPIELPKDLAVKNYCEYLGRYHTDYTLPSEYFLPAVERPAGLRIHHLDFTYLFHSSLTNPDHVRMGKGLQIRSDLESEASFVDRKSRRGKGDGSPIDLTESDLLAKGLIS